MYQRVIELLSLYGYEKVMTMAGPCYWKEESQIKKGILVLYETKPDGSAYTTDELAEMKQSCRNQIGESSPILLLLLSKTGQSSWVDDDNAFSDLFTPVSMILSSSDSKDQKVLPGRDRLWSALNTYKITILIGLVNVLVFLCSEIFGESLYRMGVLSWQSVIHDHQYYRMIVSNYIHFGWEHIFNNMLVFIVLAPKLEKMIGSFRLLVLYTGAGLAGSALSVYYYMQQGANVQCAGASGAVFGVIGALAWIMIRNKGNVQGFYGKGIFILIIGSLYHGFQSAGIDNAAHIGGCIGGFLLAIFLYRKKQEI